MLEVKVDQMEQSPFLTMQGRFDGKEKNLPDLIMCCILTW